MPKTDLLQGTLDLLILKILTLGPNHGWGIANRIRQISREGLNASQGSLYPALHRLELRRRRRVRDDRIREQPSRPRLQTDAGGPSSSGRAETASWEQFALSMKRILQSG